MKERDHSKYAPLITAIMFATLFLFGILGMVENAFTPN